MQRGKLIRLQQRQSTLNLIKTKRRLQCDISSLFFTLLCSNNYHTICTTRTIDGCCGSIFQHIHTRHIVHINHIEWHISGYTINHYQWIRVVDTTHTTNSQTHIATWCTRSSYLQTCSTSLQSSTQRRRRQLLQILLAHLSNTTRKVTFLLHTITYYHHLFKYLRTLMHRDMKHRTTIRRHSNGIITYITDLQNSRNSYI